MDAETWTRHFNELTGLVKDNAALFAQRYDELTKLVNDNAKAARKASVDAATNAAIKVTGENARAQMEIRNELLSSQAEDRRAQDVLHHKVDALGGQMNDVLVTLNKLSTAKLIQICITAFILAAAFILLVKVLGG